MEKFIELSVVEEEKHLEPNKKFLVNSLFGNDAILVNWRQAHRDPSTNRTKFPDGLLWFPWRKELWIIEVEWKLYANFFDQLRAFATGYIEENALKKILSCELDKINNTLKDIQGISSNSVVEQIVELTLSKYIKRERDGVKLEPNIWVLLGHENEKSIDKLIKNYLNELKARIGSGKYYVLSKARMFQGERGRFIHLQQHVSDSFPNTIPSSILIPVIVEDWPREECNEKATKVMTPVKKIESDTPHGTAGLLVRGMGVQV